MAPMLWILFVSLLKDNGLKPIGFLHVKYKYLFVIQSFYTFYKLHLEGKAQKIHWANWALVIDSKEKNGISIGSLEACLFVEIEAEIRHEKNALCVHY